MRWSVKYCSCHFQEETEIREVEWLFQGRREGGDPNPPSLSSVPFLPLITDFYNFSSISRTNLMNTQKSNLSKGWENVGIIIFNKLNGLSLLLKFCILIKEILMDWEKISANDITNKGLISKIHEEFLQFNNQKTNNPIKQWTEDLNRHLLKERYEDISLWKDAYHHQLSEKSKSKYNNIPPMPFRMAITKISTNDICWTGCGEKGIFLHC